MAVIPWTRLGMVFVAIATVLMAIILTGACKQMSISEQNERLKAAVLADDSAAVSDALAKGADVNAAGNNGVTPLMLAVDRLKRHAVATLLEHHADPNVKAADGNSAVNLAVENYRNAPDILFAVIKGGGDPNMRRPDDDPVIMRFLNDRNCELLGRMKDLGANLDITTRAGDPIITTAGLRADWDVVWCLIELGAKYDYEVTSRQPLSESLNDNFPAPDAPIYPYKKKVWQFLRDNGIRVHPLD